MEDIPHRNTDQQPGNKEELSPGPQNGSDLLHHDEPSQCHNINASSGQHSASNIATPEKQSTPFDQPDISKRLPVSQTAESDKLMANDASGSASSLESDIPKPVPSRVLENSPNQSKARLRSAAKLRSQKLEHDGSEILEESDHPKSIVDHARALPKWPQAERPYAKPISQVSKANRQSASPEKKTSLFTRDLSPIKSTSSKIPTPGKHSSQPRKEQINPAAKSSHDEQDTKPQPQPQPQESKIELPGPIMASNIWGELFEISRDYEAQDKADVQLRESRKGSKKPVNGNVQLSAAPNDKPPKSSPVAISNHRGLTQQNVKNMFDPDKINADLKARLAKLDVDLIKLEQKYPVPPPSDHQDTIATDKAAALPTLAGDAADAVIPEPLNTSQAIPITTPNPPITIPTSSNHTNPSNNNDDDDDDLTAPTLKNIERAFRILTFNTSRSLPSGSESPAPPLLTSAETEEQIHRVAVAFLDFIEMVRLHEQMRKIADMLLQQQQQQQREQKMKGGKEVVNGTGVGGGGGGGGGKKRSSFFDKVDTFIDGFCERFFECP